MPEGADCRAWQRQERWLQDDYVLFRGSMPVYLITVFSKGEKSTLTGKESAALKVITGNIVAEHRKRMAVPANRKGTAG
jgi:hypothetical protein